MGEYEIELLEKIARYTTFLPAIWLAVVIIMVVLIVRKFK